MKTESLLWSVPKSCLYKDLCVVNRKKKKAHTDLHFVVSEGSSNSILFFMGCALFKLSSLSGHFFRISAESLGLKII